MNPPSQIDSGSLAFFLEFLEGCLLKILHGFLQEIFPDFSRDFFLKFLLPFQGFPGNPGKFLELLDIFRQKLHQGFLSMNSMNYSNSPETTLKKSAGIPSWISTRTLSGLPPVNPSNIFLGNPPGNSAGTSP